MYFLDLNTDCIIKVLQYLDIDSLINVSQINKKLYLLARNCCSKDNLQLALKLHLLKTISQNFDRYNVPLSEVFRDTLLLSIVLFQQTVINKELFRNWIKYKNYLSHGVKKLIIQSLRCFINISDAVFVIPVINCIAEMKTFYYFNHGINKSNCILTNCKSRTCSHSIGVIYFMKENKQVVHLPCKTCGKW